MIETDSNRLQGIGPAFAVPKLLTKLGLTVADIDLFEINEVSGAVILFLILC